MKNTNAYLTAWSLMDLSEKKVLMQKFLLQNGNHFNRDSFLKFLAEQHQENQENQSHSESDFLKQGLVNEELIRLL